MRSTFPSSRLLTMCCLVLCTLVGLGFAHTARAMADLNLLAVDDPGILAEHLEHISADPQLIKQANVQAVFKALGEGKVYRSPDGKLILERDGDLVLAKDLTVYEGPTQTLELVTINNRVRRILKSQLTEDNPPPEIGGETTAPATAPSLFSELVTVTMQGLSLASVFILAAGGLAITFGLMKVINMAHGEMLMLGAYTTYVVQQALSGTFFQEWSLIIAIPCAFGFTALVGFGLEKTIIRKLYGRPLETLLATWGISLVLIQLVRLVFGAQNVDVMTPAWLSGSLPLGGSQPLPYNRLFCVGITILAIASLWFLFQRTRWGLKVQAVQWNRDMAGCVGISTERIDALTFALGSGLGGLAGLVLTQITNIGPELGQSFIIESFMVVVLGGVGSLAGTVFGGLGLGISTKFLEFFTHAVLAKIVVMTLIIAFIQKRPEGLIAFKGR